MVHYIDGQWVTDQEATLSVFDLTVLRGYGAFDFLRTYNRKPFLLGEHVDRFINSANSLSLPFPKTKEEIQNLILEGIQKNDQLDEIYVKLILTGGQADDGISPVPSRQKLLILFQKAGSYPEENFTKGIKLKLVEYERYMPEVKSLNYMSAVISLQQAKKEGASEILYVSHDHKILEGGTINFYGVLNGKLYTAPDKVLYGITRMFILQLAKEIGIPVVEEYLDASKLKDLDEAFISSTTREVMPVAFVDDIGIAKSPGPITDALMKAFNAKKAQ
mmetsp:Transcript_4238/g.5932  ORF Transcript_4238/g.5932 Transcript_4238/m.5932 type:complete len:276 (-) Transcript_4238:76-903(-)